MYLLLAIYSCLCKTNPLQCMFGNHMNHRVLHEYVQVHTTIFRIAIHGYIVGLLRIK